MMYVRVYIYIYTHMFISGLARVAGAHRKIALRDQIHGWIYFTPDRGLEHGLRPAGGVASRARLVDNMIIS